MGGGGGGWGVSVTKGITPKICRLCVCVIINQRCFESFMCFGFYFFTLLVALS